MHEPRLSPALLLSLLLVALLGSLPAPAAESPPGGAMDLDACVREALRSSPLSKGASAGTAAAVEGAAAAGGALPPEVHLSLLSRRFESRAFLPSSLFAPTGPLGGISPVIGPMNQHAYTLHASYTLFDGGERKARQAKAGALAEGARAMEGRTRADLVFEVYRAYYGLLRDREALAVAEGEVARCREHLRLAEELHRAGAVPLLDVLRARVLAADAEVSKIRAEAEAEVARGSLNTLLGRSPESPLEVVTRQREDGEEVLPSLEEALASASTHRPEVAEAETGRRAALSRLTEARSAYFPAVRLEASAGRLDDRFFPRDHDWAVGVSLSLPLFTGFSRGHEARRASLELLQAGEVERGTVLAVRREAFEAFQRAEEARAAREAVGNLVRRAEESLRMARERYAEGAGTAADLLDAEANLRAALLQEVEARFDFRIARAGLLRAAGCLLETAEE